MSNLGSISQIKLGSSAEHSSAIKDLSSGTPLVENGTIDVGDWGMSHAGLQDIWDRVNMLEVVFDVPGIDVAELSYDSNLRALNVWLTEPASQTLHLKVLGRTL